MSTPSGGELKDLLESQSYRCAYTGEVLEPHSSSVDHKEPLSLGGTSEIDNLQWVTSEINAMKGGLSHSRFIELCRVVANNANAGLPDTGLTTR